MLNKEDIILRAKINEENKEKLKFLEKELKRTIELIRDKTKELKAQQKLLNVFKAIDKYHDTDLAKEMGKIKVFTIYEDEIYNLHPAQPQKRYDDILKTIRYNDNIRQQFISKINKLEQEMRDVSAGSNNNIKN